MSIAIFFFLALIAAAIVAYPLLPGQVAARTLLAVEDADIEQAVRQLRRARVWSGRFCPSCGQGYQAGDRFCVRCGGALSEVSPVAGGLACPSCGVVLGAGDRFCAKCGHNIAAEEGV